MKSTVALALAALFLLPLGCRREHLSHDTGNAYRSAFDAQAEAGDEDDPKGISLSAEDARGVLRTHYLGKPPGSTRSRRAATGAPIIIGGGSLGSGSADGRDGGITLRAT